VKIQVVKTYQIWRGIYATVEINPEKKKPRIRQAGSAEAFLGSNATGKEHPYYPLFPKLFNNILLLQLPHFQQVTVSAQKFKEICKNFNSIFGSFVPRPLCPFSPQDRGLLVLDEVCPRYGSALHESKAQGF
jgi:hypothetical protein